MKNLKRILLLSINILLVIALLLGCAGQSETTSTTETTTDQVDETTGDTDETTGDTTEETNGTPDLSLPISEEKITLTYFANFPGTYLQVMNDYNDSVVFSEVEKRTNIHIEWIHPPDGQAAEQFNLIIASGDYPDIIQHEEWAYTYPGGFDRAISDGVYLRLNELVEQYAPNYNNVINTNSEIFRDTHTDEGNLWGFQMIELYKQEAYVGPTLRKDWLEDLNIEVPTTINDWYEMLIAFRDEKGAEAPFILEASGFANDGAFISAFDVAPKFYNDRGTVKYGPFESGYKDYLQTMNKWYSEGLIDRDFATGGNADNYLTTGVTGALNAGFWQFTRWETMSEDPNIEIIGVPYPAKEEGHRPRLRQTNRHARGFGTVITSNCEYVEEAVRYLDYFYSDEGYILGNYGIEGETFELIDGEYKFTDLVVNNPDGVAPNIAMAKYARHHGAMTRDWAREMYLYSDNANEATFTWHESADDDFRIPPISMTADEGREFSSLVGDIDTYANEMTIRFIVGDVSFDQYDDFVATIESMNISRAIEIQQAALDRYLARE